MPRSRAVSRMTFLSPSGKKMKKKKLDVLVPLLDFERRRSDWS